MTVNNELCPCGGSLYTECCAPFHQHQRTPETPEQLMRSRYSAFARHLWPYLIETHHRDFRHGLTQAILSEGPQPQWLRLEVHQSHADRDVGEVYFTAWYKDERGKVDAICERSSFIREDGKWFYSEGQHVTATLPGRNDACVCGSGKKFKQCCLRA